MTVHVLEPCSSEIPPGLDPGEQAAIVITDVVPSDAPLPEELVRSVAKRRFEFLAGRRCAEHAVSLVTGRVAPAKVGRVDRRPVWPDGVVGSITHTSWIAVAVAARTSDLFGVGVDVEDAGRVQTDLSRMILTPAEQPLARRHDSLAVRTFSAKEAGYKAINPHTGHYIGFREAEIDFAEPGAATTGFRIRYLGDHAPSRRLHDGSGLSSLHAGCVYSLFMIPAHP